MGIYNEINRKSAVLVAPLDLQAAFDTFNHQPILRVCHKRFGITGTVLKWLENYVYQRSQSVLIGFSIFKPKYMNNGVPQGSILGPILFNMFLTPLCDLLAQNQLIYQVHADDTLLCFECKFKQSSSS